MIALPLIPTRHLRPDDAVGYAAAATHGHDLIERRWVHHFYLPDRSAALRASHMLHAVGWNLLLCDAMPAPCPGWRLRVYRDTVLDPVRIHRARAQMERAARMVRGTYEGWDEHEVPLEVPVELIQGTG